MEERGAGGALCQPHPKEDANKWRGGADRMGGGPLHPDPGYAPQCLQTYVTDSSLPGLSGIRRRVGSTEIKRLRNLDLNCPIYWPPASCDYLN